jgi:hypothetical protein
MTTLLLASQKGRLEVCIFLLDHGADVEINDVVSSWKRCLRSSRDSVSRFRISIFDYIHDFLHAVDGGDCTALSR